MAVFQQIIKDKINGTPRASGDGAINSKDQGNIGLLVAYPIDQSDRNEDAYAAIKVQVADTSLGANSIKGVLLDVHHLPSDSHKGLVTIGRKGRFKIPTDGQASAGHIGQTIDISDSADGFAKSVSGGGVGEIVGIGDGTIEINGLHYDYFIVDLNFPDR